LLVLPDLFDRKKGLRLFVRCQALKSIHDGLRLLGQSAASLGLERARLAGSPNAVRPATVRIARETSCAPLVRRPVSTNV
jgi:hypothetical protein